MHIAIIDDHDLFGEMLKIMLAKLLNSESTISIYNDPQDLLRDLEGADTAIDLVFIDMMMPQMSGTEVVKIIKERKIHGDLKIIVLSGIREYKLIKEVLLLGVNGYLSKRCSPEELLAAIEHANSGQTKPFIGENVKQLLIDGDLNASDKNNITLSAREQQLLNLMCEGKMAKEMAYELDLSLNTIHYYTKRLMKKMDVNRTPDLIIKAMKMGLFTPNENQNY